MRKLGGDRWSRGRSERSRSTARYRSRRSGGREIVRSDRVDNARRAPLDQPAPLFIHEKERPLAVVVVHVRDPHRTADVEAGLVEPKLRAPLTGQVSEVIVCVVIFVAVEVIGRAMKVVSARLDAP